MKSDIVNIDRQGNGFQEAIRQTRKTAAYGELSDKQALHLQLMAEEMLSLIGSVTGDTAASFWIEAQGSRYELHLTARRRLDKAERAQLIASTTAKQNAIATTFLGQVRDAFEEAMSAEGDRGYDSLPMDVLVDLPSGNFEDPEWDGYERSILRRVADDIRIGIKKDIVDMVVSKQF